MMEISRRCPFCGLVDAIEDKCVTLDNGTMIYTHFCRGYKPDRGVCISFSGKSVEEIISIWNDGVNAPPID